MMSRHARLRLAYVVLAAADTWLTGTSPRTRRLRVLTKPLLMPALAASLASDPRAAGSPLRTSTLTAQALGWGGDLGLMGTGPGPFVAGAASFGLGHVAYTGGFIDIRRRDRRLRDAPVARGALAVWAISAPLVGRAAARREAALGVVVPVYSAALTTMLATAGNLATAQPRSARILTVAGAALFVASDTTLGMRRFVVSEPGPAMHRAVMGSYTLAQLLLAEGAARAI